MVAHNEPALSIGAYFPTNELTLCIETELTKLN